MFAFRDLSIKWKLTWIILGTSTAALLLACAAFVGYELELLSIGVEKHQAAFSSGTWLTGTPLTYLAPW